MSDVKRFSFMRCSDSDLYEKVYFAEGDCVSYKDYAALRAENDKLRSAKLELVEACEKVICAQTVKEIYDVLYSAVAKHREG